MPYHNPNQDGHMYCIDVRMYLGTLQLYIQDYAILTNTIDALSTSS